MTDSETTDGMSFKEVMTLGNEAAGAVSGKREFILEPWHFLPGCYVVFGGEECLFVGASLSSVFGAAMQLGQQRLWQVSEEYEGFKKVLYEFHTVEGSFSAGQLADRVGQMQKGLIETYLPTWPKGRSRATATVSIFTGRPKDKRSVEEKVAAEERARRYKYRLRELNTLEVEAEERALTSKTPLLDEILEGLED